MGDLVLLDNERRKRRIAADRATYEADRAHRRRESSERLARLLGDDPNLPGAA